MSRKIAIGVLAEKGNVTLKCNGNSMRPLMAPGDTLHIKKVEPQKLRVGDAVFCKVNHGLQVHKISAMDETKGRWQISNNSGFANGWIGSSNIYGLCVMVNDRVLVSDAELDKR
jgi:hypothetical protein